MAIDLQGLHSDKLDVHHVAPIVPSVYAAHPASPQ